MITFNLKIRELTNLTIKNPNLKAQQFNLKNWNTEEILEKIMAHTTEEEFTKIVIRGGEIVDGILRMSTISCLINGIIDYKGVSYENFTQEQWDTFNNFVFEVDIDNSNKEEAIELFLSLNKKCF